MIGDQGGLVEIDEIGLLGSQPDTVIVFATTAEAATWVATQVSRPAGERKLRDCGIARLTTMTHGRKASWTHPGRWPQLSEVHSTPLSLSSFALKRLRRFGRPPKISPRR